MFGTSLFGTSVIALVIAGSSLVSARLGATGSLRAPVHVPAGVNAGRTPRHLDLGIAAEEKARR